MTLILWGSGSSSERVRGRWFSEATPWKSRTSSGSTCSPGWSVKRWKNKENTKRLLEAHVRTTTGKGKDTFLLLLSHCKSKSSSKTKVILDAEVPRNLSVSLYYPDSYTFITITSTTLEFQNLITEFVSTNLLLCIYEAIGNLLVSWIVG